MANKVFYYVFYNDSWWEILEYPYDYNIEEQIRNGMKVSEKEMVQIVGVVPYKFSIYVAFYE